MFEHTRLSAHINRYCTHLFHNAIWTIKPITVKSVITKIFKKSLHLMILRKRFLAFIFRATGSSCSRRNFGRGRLQAAYPVIWGLTFVTAVCGQPNSLTNYLFGGDAPVDTGSLHRKDAFSCHSTSSSQVFCLLLSSENLLIFFAFRVISSTVAISILHFGYIFFAWDKRSYLRPLLIIFF